MFLFILEELINYETPKSNQINKRANKNRT